MLLVIFREMASTVPAPTPPHRSVNYSIGPNGQFTMGSDIGLGGIGNGLTGGVSLGTKFKNTKGSFFNDAIQSQVPMNQQYFVEHDDNYLVETGAKQIIFMRKDATSRGSSHYVRCHQLLGVSALNRRLEHDRAFLNAYGNEPDTKKFQRDWGFAGIQLGQAARWVNDNSQLVQTLTIGRRARMFCPHAMLNFRSQNREIVQNGDELYLVMRRYPKKDEIGEEFAETSAYSGVKRSYFGEENAKKKGPSYYDEDDMDEADEKDPSRKKGRQYFWRIEPYVSRDGCPPPLSAYCFSGQTLDFMSNDETEWTGCFFYLGLVHEVHGEMSYNIEIASEAKKFFFPQSSGTAYKEAGNKIPDVVIQVRV